MSPPVTPVFRKASRREAKLRMLLNGPSGSGKTYTALRVGCELAKLAGGPLCFIDSERGSADKYADEFDFEVCELEGEFDPKLYIQAMHAAVRMGASVVVVDSASHAWAGTGGVQDIVDGAKARFGGNTHKAWAVGTPAWRDFVDALVQLRAHTIVTTRAKTVWGEERTASGKMVPAKIGTAPVAREGFEYEFDLAGDLSLDHELTFSKNRTRGAVRELWREPGADLAAALHSWLVAGGADGQARWRDLVALLPEGVKAAALRDALLEEGIENADALIDDAVFEKARGVAQGVGQEAPVAAAG